jgi:hypothetical protein
MYSAELRSTLPVHRQMPWRAREAMDEAGLSKPMGGLKAQSAALLRGLFLNLQPASVGIPKHIPQIDDLVGHHWIGTRLQQGLECIVDQIEVVLLSSCFSTAVTPDKAASVIRSPKQYRYRALRNSSGSLAMFAAMRSASSSF